MSPVSLAEIVPFIQGSYNAQFLAIAAFTVTVYDYFLTLDDEVKYFWAGPWAISRILYFTNRYLPPCIMIVGLICFFAPNLTPEVRQFGSFYGRTPHSRYSTYQFCVSAISAELLLNVVSVGTIQGTLVIRVWYLYSHSWSTRVMTLVVFIASLVISLYYAHTLLDYVALHHRQSLVLPSLPHLHLQGCGSVAPPPKGFWRLFLPSLVLHTILYILTAIRGLKNRRPLKRSPVIKCLIRDGGLFFLVVALSVGFTTIGTFMESRPEVNIPAVYSNFILAATSVSISRVMLSIHSLAAKLGSDTRWLLNDVELSRVNWRKGLHEGEIFVDIQSMEGDMEGDKELASISIKLSRAGVMEDSPL